GRADIASDVDELVVEGLPPNDSRSLYGGTDDNDDSGVLKYVSIRHGGAELAPGEEINGLTLGAVGAQTLIEHVEVFANEDDGIEWFGGTVSVKWASVAYCGDDSYDYDLGWRGNGQFWFSLQDPVAGDNAGEHDGADPDAAQPSSNPTIYNVTFIGSGENGTAKNEHALFMRDGTCGTYANSIFTEFANFAIQVEDVASGYDSRECMENGDLNILNNLWWTFGAGDQLNAGTNGIIQATDGAQDPNAQFLIDHLGDNGNSLSDPDLEGVSRATDNGLDPRPGSGSPAFSNLANLPGDPFFSAVDYKGAFGNSLWLRGWTAIDDLGFLPEQQTITITDNDLQGNQSYVWTNDNVYLLDGFVYLEDGGELTIEAGTVIKGIANPSTNDLASTLIITRGAKIFAHGEAGSPIIFTTELDDENDPDDMFLSDRGLWGGLIILGRADIASDVDELVVEGLPPNDARSLYGGSNDNDDSGVLKYVSIRHGGAELAPGEEINGLTLGAVGSATDISYVEVLANEDDGIEWFGGTVSVKYAVVGFCGDDAVDFDLGWRGNGQFWLVLQDPNIGDNAAEMDGADPDAAQPSSNPVIYNTTYIGAGTNSVAKNEHALYFRDGTCGTYANSIFTDFANFAIQVEDLASGYDSRECMENGQLRVLNNIWWDFGAGDQLNAGGNGIIQATDGAEDPNAQFLIDHLSDNCNTLEDPGLQISRTTDGNFNPIPTMGVSGDLHNYPTSGDFFTPVCFKGAFSPSGVWIKNWTALSEYGLLDNSLLCENTPAEDEDCNFCDNVTSVEEITEQKGFVLEQMNPNPTNGLATLNIELPAAAVVSLRVYDITGRPVAVLADQENWNAGTRQLNIDLTALANGVYYYALESDEVVLTRSVVVAK
ncbi:MAG: T9SS type A sorting domain-containing protein, partial [Bacteroidota bacterium]